MIVHLKGKLLEFQEDHILLENPFSIFYIDITEDLKTKLIPIPLNDEVSIHVHCFLSKLNENLSEFKMYGFFNLEEKNIFFYLINVSGIGHKKAIHILQQASYKKIIYYILEKDTIRLSKIKGIGKKSDQIILELHDKFYKIYKEYMQNKEIIFKDEVFEVLKNLGYQEKSIRYSFDKCLIDAPKDKIFDIEYFIKECLKYLSNI